MEEIAENGLEHGDMALCFEFKRMNNRIVRCIHSGLVREGFDEITIMHGWILGFLYDNSDKKVYQRDLEKQFGIAKSTATNILKLMEKKGYVMRVQDDGDARLKMLKLTRLGRDTQQRVMRVIDGLHDSMEKGITDEERKTFYNILDKITHNIETDKEV